MRLIKLNKIPFGTTEFVKKTNEGYYLLNEDEQEQATHIANNTANIGVILVEC